MRFLENPEGCPPISQLGWDPLLNMPSLDEFSSALAKQRRAVKALLLDQVRGWGEGYGQTLGRICWAGASECHCSENHLLEPKNSHSFVVHVGHAPCSMHPGPCILVHACRLAPPPVLHSVLVRPPMLQSFSAGIGNWVADEVLYQVRPPCCAATRSGHVRCLIMGRACQLVYALASGWALPNTYPR